MRVIKIGHCCLLIEEGDATLLTDPGDFTTGQTDVKSVDGVLITHEHGDHCHVDSLKTVLENNPTARVFTNHGVGKVLDEEGIPYELLEDGGGIAVNGVRVEGYGKDHKKIYPGFPVVPNTGFLIGGRLFYPGDAFYNPDTPVEILALPVSGPWMNISEAVDYAKEVRPRYAFPVHDGGLIPGREGGAYKVPARELPSAGCEFVVPEDGTPMEF